jgi:hypothetical protein
MSHYFEVLTISTNGTGEMPLYLFEVQQNEDWKTI